jgi:hypothetical protein
MSDTTITVQRITDFGEEPYTLREAIPVAIESTGDDYVAGFVEGCVYASGDTEREAVENLASSILDTFETLTEDRDRLAPVAEKQFQVLSRIIVPHASTNQA